MASKTALMLVCSLLVLSIARAEDDRVLHLSLSNITDALYGKESLVLFFSPSCGHCIHFKPTWAEFAKQYNGSVVLGDVDCIKESNLMSEFEIDAFPVLLYLKGFNKYKFTGERTVDRLNEFVNGGYVKFPQSYAPGRLQPKEETALREKANLPQTTTRSTSNLIVAVAIVGALALICVVGRYIKKDGGNQNIEEVGEVKEDEEENQIERKEGGTYEESVIEVEMTGI